MGPGVQRVRSINGISESRLIRGYWRRLSLTERDESGIRDGELLVNGERRIYDAILAYLKRGGSFDYVESLRIDALRQLMRDLEKGRDAAT